MKYWSMFCFGLVGLAFAWMFFAPAPGERNEEQAVKTTVDEYVSAFAKGDGTGACDRLTGKAKAAVIRMGASLGASDCPSAMAKTHEIGGTEMAAIALRIRVRKVQVDNAKARVTLDAEGDDGIADLEKIGDDWKIASLPAG